MTKDQTDALRELATAMRSIAGEIDLLLDPSLGAEAPQREELVHNGLREFAGALTLYLANAARPAVDTHTEPAQP